MSDVLRGNFTPKRTVDVTEEAASLETRFEQEAMKRLGGSIAFVSKHKVVWGEENESSPSEPTPESVTITKK